MKEFKGTSGEWQFDNINMKIKGTGDIEGRTVIANVSPEMDYSRGMTTQCANARLISASPELLDALHVCWSSLKTYGDHPIIDKQCKLAINKALGL